MPVPMVAPAADVVAVNAAGTSASLGRVRNAARSVNPGMRRQAITEPIVLHEHLFVCQDGRNR